MFPIRNKTK